MHLKDTNDTLMLISNFIRRDQMSDMYNFYSHYHLDFNNTVQDCTHNFPKEGILKIWKLLCHSQCRTCLLAVGWSHSLLRAESLVIWAHPSHCCAERRCPSPASTCCQRPVLSIRQLNISLFMNSVVRQWWGRGAGCQLPLLSNHSIDLNRTNYYMQFAPWGIKQGFLKCGDNSSLTYSTET